MKSYLLFSASILFFIHSEAQQNSYYQQEVNYKIVVKLDDEQHILHAYEEFEYTNNSPDALEFIYIHLWPNAYKNRQTAFAKQKVKLGSQGFYFGGEKNRGFIDSLDFRIDGTSAILEPDPGNPDIGKLILNEPLGPNESITISTPFRVKLPGSYSRLGHVKQQYQITQWYPKPAVYDHDGWHPMPYLDQGEFYSEFGSFDVSITVPKNYVVGATGVLQNQEELEFLDSLSAETNSITEVPTFSEDTFPKSSETWKTLRYVQDNIHDFAWFADKRYIAQQGEVILPNSGRKVKLLALYNKNNHDVWEDIIEYMHDGVYYYSKWIGDYPYDIVTVVDGALSAGAGMEYPTITVLGAGSPFFLETVTVHEIGHNWFYGILGSNERIHPWQDEGLNSYYELRYYATKYPEMSLLNLNDTSTEDNFGKKLAHFVGIDEWKQFEAYNLAYRSIAGYNRDQPNETHSNQFTSINYGIISYQKTAYLLDFLNHYLGEEVFDNCMQAYFNKWQFKHPQPSDLQDIFEEISGEKLDWLFQEFLGTSKKYDIAMSGIKQVGDNYDIVLKNKKQIQAPVKITAFKGENVLAEKWIEGFESEETIAFNTPNADQFKINHDKRLADLKTSNNTIKTKGLFKKASPLQLKLLGKVDDSEKHVLSWIPAIWGNTVDKTLLGLTFYNTTIPNKPLFILANPMYSFGRNAHAGLYQLEYSWYPTEKFEEIRLGGLFKEFAGYQKYSGSITFNFRNQKPLYNADHQLDISHSYLSNDIRYLGFYDEELHLGSISYQMKYGDAIKFFETNFDFSTDYDRFTLLETRFSYSRAYKRGRFYRLSAYLGKFLSSEDLPETYQLYLSGGTDYEMNDIFIDRAQTSRRMKLQEYQTNLSQGAMRGFIPVSSSNGVFTLKADIDMPFTRMIFTFLDTGIDLEDGAVYYSTGVGFKLGPLIQMYIPVFGDAYEGGSSDTFKQITQSIQFQIDLNSINPKSFIKSNLQ